jgi:activator of HSP90 ATPase
MSKKQRKEKPKLSVIRQSVVVNASPAQVYEAYMDSKTHAEITGSPARMSSRAGEKFTAWDGYILGKNLELVKGKKIVQEWTTTEWPEGYPPSRLEIKLTAKGEGTVLTMIHSDVPAEQRDDYAEGWRDYYWEPLKKHFEGEK